MKFFLGLNLFWISFSSSGQKLGQVTFDSLRQYSITREDSIIDIWGMRLPVLLLFLLVSCSQKHVVHLDNCSDFKSSIYENPGLNIDVFLPDNWETEVDFIMGDTISVTALDTSYFYQTDELRSIGIIQYSSIAKPSMNLEAIEMSLNSNPNVDLISNGEVIIKDLNLPYFLVYETGEYSTSNLIIHIQYNSDVINLFLRMDGQKSNVDDFCIFNELIYANGKQSI